MPESAPYPSTQPDGRTPHDGSAPPPPVGLVGDYELLSELAAGGMGVVYKARQRSLNRVVALKMLLPGRLTSEVGRARFRAEAEATAELDHPNIVPIFEVGEHAGRPFFTMKLIDGGTLGDLLRRSPRPPLRDLVGAVAKVCRAVHFAHQRGILHRDLKPGNVLVDAAGEPFVADFGLAKRVGADDGLTATGAVLGTPAYMAPEQAGDTGHAVTTLTDVYALGAVLYEVLTGRPPFAAPDVGTLLAQIRGDAPAAPSTFGGDVPRDLELVCLKCLAKVPTERYAAAGDVADELDRWLRGDPVEVRAPGLVSRMAAWARRNSRTAVWAAIIGTVWGLFGPQLPLVTTGLGIVFLRLSNTMDQFPSAAPWWLPRVERPPAILLAAALVTSVALHLSVGMLTYLLTRSFGRQSHLVGAAAVGLIAGLVAFTLYLGPAALIMTAVVPTTDDLATLANGLPVREPSPGSTGPHPQDELVARYPELAPVAEPDRGPLVYSKIVATGVIGIYKGLVIGMALTLAYAMPVSVGGTALAASLVRRTGSPRSALVPYLEVSLAVSVGWLDLVILTLDAAGATRIPGIGLQGWVLTVFLLTAPPWVVLRGWSGRNRWRLYSLGMGAVILFDLWGNNPADGHAVWVRWAALAVFGLAAAATAYRWWPRPASPTPPAGHSPTRAPDRPTRTET